jgi:hypothetical protein
MPGSTNQSRDLGAIKTRDGDAAPNFVNFLGVKAEKRAEELVEVASDLARRTIDHRFSLRYMIRTPSKFIPHNSDFRRLAARSFLGFWQEHGSINLIAYVNCAGK